MLSINTNLSSLIAQRSMKSATQLLNQSIERMTTGYKINHSKDNAANYSIITNMNSKISSYVVAEDNCAMGLDMLTTATESLDLIYDKLTRLRDLAEQASNGTYGEQSLKAINSEANALVDEINRIYSTAEYNGLKLFGSDETQDVEPTQASEPIATFGMARTTSTEYYFISDPVTYSETQISSMQSITEAISDSALISGGFYTISTPDELVALRTFVNGGGDTTGMTFVLANDLDLSEITNFTPIGTSYNSFKGVFNGNGYVIKNLKVNLGNKDGGGLFGYAIGATVLNLGVVDCNVSVGPYRAYVGGLIGEGGSRIENCFVTGSVSGGGRKGGLVGQNDDNAIIKDCYVKVSVRGGESGSFYVGGFIGELGAGSEVTNCFSEASITGGNRYVGGFVGGADDSIITNCYSLGDMTCEIGHRFAYGRYDATISNAYSSMIRDGTEATWGSDDWDGTAYTIDPSVPGNYPGRVWPPVEQGAGSVTAGGSGVVMLQISTDSSWSSQIEVDLSFVLTDIDDLRGIGLDQVTDFLTLIDNYITTVSDKQVTYGAAQNRLESALDEISTKYENLVSSRSTLRDADIAEVSSQYIQQQILQQASATLLATANQAPSIALQLI